MHQNERGLGDSIGRYVNGNALLMPIELDFGAFVLHIGVNPDRSLRVFRYSAAMVDDLSRNAVLSD